MSKSLKEQSRADYKSAHVLFCSTWDEQVLFLKQCTLITEMVLEEKKKREENKDVIQ